MANFYKTNNSSEINNVWIKLNLKISLKSKKILSVEFSDFIEEPRYKSDRWSSKYRINHEKSVDAGGKNYEITHLAPTFKNSNTEYSPEQKAKSKIWLFTKDFEELLLEYLGFDSD